MRHFKHLTFNDRLKIESWLRVGVSKKEIADLLCVHISTIYRELKRGEYLRLNSDTYEYKKSYSPDIAYSKYRDNLSSKGPSLKVGNDFNFCNYVEHKIINDKYSPAAVLGEIESKSLNFNTKICVSTLYNYIDKGVFLNLTNKHLPVKRSNHKTYKRVKASRSCIGTSIEKRPEEVSDRNTFGHWEMDCVIGKRETRKTLLVLTERYTRQEIIKIMKDKTANSVVKAIDRIEKQLGTRKFKKMFRSITVDNGCEFQDFKCLERSVFTGSKRTQVYYCHPYCSYERGSNENQNKFIRRHYPKGTSFDSLTQSDVDSLQNWINNYPRKIFNWCTSNDVFEACMNCI